MARVLLACQRSVLLRDLLRKQGHDAHTCDLEYAEDGDWRFHFRMDAIVVAENFGPWDAMIAMPECRDLCGSGIHWNNRGRRGMTSAQAWEATDKAFGFANKLRNMPFDKVVVENSVGILSREWGKAQQIVQPYNFGEDASKATCLWIRGLPKLNPSAFVPPRMVCNGCGLRNEWSIDCGYPKPRPISCELCHGKLYPRWANQTDSGQNKLAPSATRSADRARTYPGIAMAMAEQWGPLL